MACCFFRFRDQEFLKSLILRKAKRKSPNSLRSDRVDFRFHAKFRDLRISKSLQSQNLQAIFGRFPLLFPWLSILRAKLNDSFLNRQHFHGYKNNTNGKGNFMENSSPDWMFFLSPSLRPPPDKKSPFSNPPEKALPAPRSFHH